MGKFWKMVFFLSVSFTNFAIFWGKNYSPFFHIAKLKKMKRKNWVRDYLTRIFHYYLACIFKNI